MHDDYWRLVPDYPDYAVSRRGEVRSLKRNKLLAQTRGERGYLAVNLYRDNEPRHFLVHRLVAAAFIGPIPPGMQVNHKDTDKTNNELANLEVITPDDNMK